MTAHRDLAIVIGAAVALFVGYGSVQMMDKPAPKGHKLTVQSPVSPPASQPAQPPAALEPQPTVTVEPMAAGPALSETPKPVVSAPLPRLHVKHVKRKARRIARAKVDPCVGPLCALVAAR